MDGQIIGGDFSSIKVRQKSDLDFEIGELIVCEFDDKKIIYKITDLNFSSQISDQNLELISGLNLEKEIDHKIIENDLRNYIVANLKSLLLIQFNKIYICKIMPKFFTPIRRVVSSDFDFMSEETLPDSMLFGKLRSGSQLLDVDINLPGRDVYSHHILISATTGKGKSNLVKNLLFNSLDKSFVANLVLDPHNEYFGSTSYGLKDHNKANEYLTFYSNNKVNTNIGVNSLKINIRLIEPFHLRGVLNLSDAQWQALFLAHNNFKKEWLLSFFDNRFNQTCVQSNLVKEDTYKVLIRSFTNLFSINVNSNTEKIESKGIFAIDEMEANSFITDITKKLESSKTVIIDTSSISSKLEILIGSLISSNIFNLYRSYKMKGELDNKPIVNIVLEEAPRVLGKEVLEKGSNIFDSIAREGRKFKIGLTAITQLPSLIPKTILANINSKIILGTENSSERQAIIDSAAQDLSADSRNIASLDKGEAIISSNFAKFAIPIKTPLFDDTINLHKAEVKESNTNIYTNKTIETDNTENKIHISGMDYD